MKEFDCAESDLRYSRTVGEPDLLATWSDPDSPEAVMKARNNCIKLGDHGTLKSRTSRLYCTIKFVVRKYNSFTLHDFPYPAQTKILNLYSLTFWRVVRVTVPSGG